MNLATAAFVTRLRRDTSRYGHDLTLISQPGCLSRVWACKHCGLRAAATCGLHERRDSMGLIERVGSSEVDPNLFQQCNCTEAQP